MHDCAVRVGVNAERAEKTTCRPNHSGGSSSAASYTTMGVTTVYDPDRNEIRLGVDPVASTACRRGTSTREISVLADAV